MAARKVITGTMSNKGSAKVTKGTPGRGSDVRTFRCRCGGIAIATPDGVGGIVYACKVCKTPYISSSLD